MKKLIFSLILACLSVCGLAAPADGIYFLRATNVGDGSYYLARGNAYGTQAILDSYGLAVSVSTSRGNTIITFIDRYLLNNRNVLFKPYDASTVFTNYDSNAQQQKRGNNNWTISENGTTYRISNKETSTQYVRADTDPSSTWQVLWVNGDASNCIEWEFETPAAHAVKMSALRESASSCPNPGIQYVRSSDNLVDLATNVNEHFNGHSEARDYDKRLFHDSITLKPGLYKLSVPAFYRMREPGSTNNNKNTLYSYYESGADCPPLYLYIKDRKVQLHSLFDYEAEDTSNALRFPNNNNGKYYPNDTTSAKKVFEAGKYRNEVWINIDTEETVEYGIYEIGNPEANGHWACWSEKLIELVQYVPAPVPDGIYFLKAASAANNLYMSRGNNYGTRTVLDYWGVPIQVSTTQEGVTTLKVADMNRYIYGFTNENNCYTDIVGNENDKSIDWVLLQNGRYFKLQSNANPGKYLRYDPAENQEWKNLFTDGTDQNGTVIEWFFQTPAEHKQEMDSLREDLRQHPDIQGLQEFSYMTRNSSLTEGDIQEHFNENGADANHLTADRQRLARETEVLMPGIYKLTIPAFYRMGTNDFVYDNLHVNDADCPPVYAYFGSKKVQLYSVFDQTVITNASDTVSKGGQCYPNGKLSAADAFNDGKYRNEIWLEVDAPTQVPYGIYELGHPIKTQHWLCWAEAGIELVRYSDDLYHYGEPQANKRILNENEVATVTFNNYQEQHGASMPVLQQDYSGVTLTGSNGVSKNATELQIVNGSQGFRFTMPSGLTPGETYTLNIPVNALHYEGDTRSGEDYHIEIHSRVIADGTYFLKATNIAGKAIYLSRGNTYGTRAMLDNWGLPIRVTTDDDNHTRIFFEDTGANGYLYDVNTNAYCDWPQPNVGAEATYWNLSAENGQVRISRNANTDEYLRINPAESGWKNIYTNGSNTTGTVIEWEFESPSAHQTAMDTLRREAASQTLKDASQAYQQLTYNSCTADDITAVQEHFNVYDSGGDVWGGSTRPLRPGIYKFSVPAFYRMASNDVTYPLHTADADCPPVYLYIGTDTVQIHSVYDYSTTDDETYNQGDNHYPNSKASALRAFKEGSFRNEIWFEVTQPSTVLKFGLHKQGKPGHNSHWLCWAENYELVCYFDNTTGQEYFVGAPNLEHGFAQPENTVTIVCEDSFKPDGSQVALTTDNSLRNSFKFGSTPLSTLRTATNFTFTMPQSAEPGHTYEVYVPEGAFYYDVNGTLYKSPETTLLLQTPEVFDGTYFLQTTVDDKVHYLSRGNDWGMRAVLDRWGQPVSVVTDMDNHTMFKYVDQGDLSMFYSLDEGTRQQIYTDGGGDRGDYRYWNLQKQDESFRISSLHMVEGTHVSKHVDDNNIYTDGEGVALDWKFITIGEHDTDMQQLRDAVVADDPSRLGVQVTLQNGVEYSIRVSDGSPQTLDGEQINDYPRRSTLNGTFVATAPGYYNIRLQAYQGLTSNAQVPEGFSPCAIFTFGDKQLQVNKQSGNAATATISNTYTYYNDIWIRIDNEGRYNFSLVLNSHTNINAATQEYRLRYKQEISITRYYTEEDGIETQEERERKLSNLYPKGDVNYSGTIDSNDIDALVSMVLGERVTSLPAHMYSESGQADIRDLTQLYNIMENRVNTQVDANDADSENALQAEPATVKRFTPQVPDDPANYPNDSEVDFYMYSKSARSAWQMSLDIPQGMKILGDCKVVQEGDADGHYARHSKLSKSSRDGYDTYKLIMVSPLQHSIQGKILSLTLVADESYSGGALRDSLYPIYVHNVIMDDATNTHNITEIPLSSSYVFVGAPKAQLFVAKGEVPAIVTSKLNEDTRLGITSIDLTSSDIVIGGTLAPANPNTVVYANTPLRLANCNEVVDGVCDNLQVVERNDFGAAYPFSARGASYYRSMTGATTWGALVLPFDVQIDPSKPYDLYRTGSADPSDPTLIVLHRLSGTVAAGTPVLVRRGDNATSLQLNAANVNVMAGDSHTLVDAEGALIPSGTFVERRIDEGFYVAQNQLWDAEQKTGGTTLYPFRSYYLAKPGINAASIRFTIGEDDEEEQANGLSVINDILEGTATFYDLNGIRRDDLQPGMNIVRRADGSTRKILIRQ